MKALLDLFTSREAIVVLACAGALLTAYGSYAVGNGSPGALRRGRRFVKSGYAVTGLSLLAFVLAGFLSGA